MARHINEMIAPERIVIVGASLAGLRAAEALRREGFVGQLTLIGDEPYPATILILERERTHPQAVSSSCFIVDSHSTGTFGSALPFRSHINSPGILRPAVATLQDGQLYA